MMRPLPIVLALWTGFLVSGCLLDIDRGRLDRGVPDGADADPDVDVSIADDSGDDGAGLEDAGVEDAGVEDAGVEDAGGGGERGVLAVFGINDTNAVLTLVDGETLSPVTTVPPVSQFSELFCSGSTTVFALSVIDERTDRLQRLRRTGPGLVRSGSRDFTDVHPSSAVLLSTGEVAVTFRSRDRVAFFSDDLRTELATVPLASLDSSLDGDGFPDVAGALEADGILWLTLPHLDHRFAPPTAAAAGTLGAIDPDRRLLIDLQPGTPATVDGLALSSFLLGSPVAHDPLRRRFHVATRGPAGDGVGGELLAVDTGSPVPRALPPLTDTSDAIGRVVVFPALGRGWGHVASGSPHEEHVVPFDLETGARGEPLDLLARAVYLTAALGDERLAVIDSERSSDAIRVFDAADGTELDLPPVALDWTRFACWMPASEGP
jgi:hypothetical protein